MDAIELSNLCSTFLKYPWFFKCFFKCFECVFLCLHLFSGLWLSLAVFGAVFCLFEVQDTVRRLRPGAESFYPAGVTHFNLLNPQVVESWQSLLLDTANL